MYIAGLTKSSEACLYKGAIHADLADINRTCRSGCGDSLPILNAICDQNLLLTSC